MTNKRFRCINVTLAARLIGVFDLITSIIAIDLLAEEFLRDEERLIVFHDVKILLGLSWANNSTEEKARNKFDNTWILICLMVYSTSYFFCSVGLIVATISKKNNYTSPWLTLEIISLGNQANDVILRLFQYRCENYENDRIAASFPLASFHLLLSLYFWIIVFTAQKSWPEISTSENFAESKDEKI